MIRRLVDYICQKCEYTVTAMYTTTNPSAQVRCPRCPGVSKLQANEKRHQRCIEIDQRQKARGLPTLSMKGTT